MAVETTHRVEFEGSKWTYHPLLGGGNLLGGRHGVTSGERAWEILGEEIAELNDTIKDLQQLREIIHMDVIKKRGISL